MSVRLISVRKLGKSTVSELEFRSLFGVVLSPYGYPLIYVDGLVNPHLNAQRMSSGSQSISAAFVDFLNAILISNVPLVFFNNYKQFTCLTISVRAP